MSEGYFVFVCDFYGGGCFIEKLLDVILLVRKFVIDLYLMVVSGKVVIEVILV